MPRYGLAIWILTSVGCQQGEREHASIRAEALTETVGDVSTRRAAVPTASASPEAMIAAEIDSYLAAEPRDDAWASSREQHFRVDLGRVHGVTVSNTECKTRLCRIELGFSDNASQADFLKNLHSAEPKHQLYAGGVAHMLVHRPEKQTVTWWMSRPGYGLPQNGQAPKPIEPRAGTLLGGLAAAPQP